MKANPAFPILSRPAPTMRTFRHFIAILAISLTIGRPGAAADSLVHHRPILTEEDKGPNHVVEPDVDGKTVREFSDKVAPYMNTSHASSFHRVEYRNLWIGNVMRRREGRGAQTSEVAHEKEKHAVRKWDDHSLSSEKAFLSPDGLEVASFHGHRALWHPCRRRDEAPCLPPTRRHCFPPTLKRPAGQENPARPSPTQNRKVHHSNHPPL